MRFAAALLALLCAASPALADEVVLKNGDSIQGRVVHVGRTHVVIDIGGGRVTFEKHLVSEIHYDKESALEIAESLLKAVKGTRDPLELWRMADWCERNSVSKHVRDLIEKALELDKNDNRMSKGRYMLSLIREGIGEKVLKTYVRLFKITTDIQEDERRKLIDGGMEVGFADWLISRQPKPVTAVKPPAPKTKRSSSTVNRSSKDNKRSTMNEERRSYGQKYTSRRYQPPAYPPPVDFGCERYRMPPTLIVAPQLYPTYIPQYYGPYIYWYPYLPPPIGYDTAKEPRSSGYRESSYR